MNRFGSHQVIDCVVPSGQNSGSVFDVGMPSHPLDPFTTYVTNADGTPL